MKLPLSPRSIGIVALGVTGLLAAAGCTSSTGGRTLGEQSQSGLGAIETAQSDDYSQLPERTVDPDAAQYWDQLSPLEQAASVLMLHYPGTDVSQIKTFVDDIRPAGLILMSDNVPDPESGLTQSIAQWGQVGGLPLLVAIDQEGGLVSRLADDPGESPEDLRDQDPAQTEASFHARGEYLKSLGINTNFGIVADTTADENAAIWPRVLGTTPEAAAERVSAAVAGENGEVFSTLKHFPGHGLIEEDSHFTVPVGSIDPDQWAQTAALPFAAGIDAGAEMVMVGHLLFPEIAPEPASLSARWNQILRQQLGFDGIIVTDDLKMLRDSGEAQFADPVANAVAALNAGATLVLDIDGDTGPAATAFAHELVNGIAAAVQDGSLPHQQLREAGIRLTELRSSLAE
ncbi:glycoside hydrolase family 3 N-terminal domain-containing protein [Actinomyces sp. F1_1611]